MICRGRTSSGVVAGLALSLLLGWTQAARADTDLGPVSATGQFELGYQGVSDDFGSAKYEQYRDERPGLISSGWFLLEDEAGEHYMNGRLRDLTRKDQEYDLRGGRYGRYRIDLGFSQMPQVYSNNAFSPYQGGSDANLVLPPGWDPAAFAASLNTFGSGRSLEFRQRRSYANITAWLSEDLTLDAGYTLQQDEGTRLLGLGFGNPGPNGAFVNVAAPIDEDTQTLTASLGLLRGPWSLGLDYRGSFFRNEYDSVTVDNPFALAGPAAGRAALAPDNSSNSLSLSAARSLGLDFPARFAGTVSIDFRRQDEAFLEHTINPALAGDPSLVLPADDLDGEMLTYLVNLLFTARPRPQLNLKARYRLYEYDNRTDTLSFAGHVENDNSLSTQTLIAARNEYTKQNASVDASYRIARATRLTLGYAWENWNRSDVRSVTHQNEHTGTVKLHVRPAPGTEIRAEYAHARRSGNDYDFAASIKETHVPADVPGAVVTNVFPPLRKFPQADRIENRFNLLATVAATERLFLTWTGTYRYDDYNDTDFGLTDERAWSIAFDTEYQPSSRVGFAAYYSYDDVRWRQRSRLRPRNFVPPIVVVDDPANNWKSRSTDRAHNFGITLKAALIPERLDARLSWDYQDGKALTRASGAAGAAVDYPSTKDNLQVISAMFDYQLSEQIKVTTGYRFERFDRSDFQTDDEPPFSTNFGGVANGLFLRDGIDDYEAHVFLTSLTYQF